eukprot:10632247-Alexandrium_andersonii.AAC.1
MDIDEEVPMHTWEMAIEAVGRIEVAQLEDGSLLHVPESSAPIHQPGYALPEVRADPEAGGKYVSVAHAA